jgi:NAD(P)-dependent dehydrogenase (short-subunit alcohol dehydrogenase family)
VKTVLVTGSSGGIGAATVHAFAEAGWYTVGIDRRPPPPGPVPHESATVDLADAAHLVAYLRELRDRVELHAVVNNGAIQVNRALVDTTDEEWAEVLDINVRSAFQAIRETAPALRETRGAVVNVSSVHALATSLNVAAYAASKGALLALTRAAALELARDGIRVNAVVPGAVDTAMFRDGLERRPHPEGAAGNFDEVLRRTPLGFVADPKLVAEVIVFLSDPLRSGYVTGQTIVADGGVLAHLSTE